MSHRKSGHPFHAVAALALFALTPAWAQFPDKDGDGVPNDLDDCPYTTAGAKVDRQGCALDEDFDGVADGLDACPGTALGAAVDGEGCTRIQIAAPAAPAAPAVAPPPPAPVVEIAKPAPLPETPKPAAVIQAPPAAPAPVVALPVAPAPSGAPPVAVDPFSTREPTDVAPPAAEAPLVIPEPAPLPPPVVAKPVLPPVPVERTGTPEIFTYSADGAPATTEVQTGKVQVPAMRTPSRVPPEVKAALDAPRPGAVTVKLPKRRPQAPTASAIARVPQPLPIAVTPAPAPVAASAPQSVSSAPVPVAGPVFISGRMVTVQSPVPRGVAPQAPAPAVRAPQPVRETVPSATWTVRLASVSEIGSAGSAALNDIAAKIRLTQRDNPLLNYEIVGGDSSARLVRSYLVAQGVASNRVSAKAAGGGAQVEIRPALD